MFQLDGIGRLLRSGLVEYDYVSHIGAGVGPIMVWDVLGPWILYYRETREIPDY
jgi:hypothetical protein